MVAAAFACIVADKIGKICSKTPAEHVATQSQLVKDPCSRVVTHGVIPGEPHQGTGNQLSSNRRGPPHGALRSWRAAMEHYVGLDVSLELTSICVVDQRGKIVREGVVASTPEAIAAFIKARAPHVVRIGLETGATSTWL